jgi:hypothetical protein
MGTLYGVEETFGTVLILVVVVAGLVAAITYMGAPRLYERIGKGTFALDEPDHPPGPHPGSPAARAEAEAEIRQMVQAKSDRREQRGEAPLDVEAEVSALMSPAPSHDEALRDEVRQLVIARNERRKRRGEAPLDVEAEVERQLRELGG